MSEPAAKVEKKPVEMFNPRELRLNFVRKNGLWEARVDRGQPFQGASCAAATKGQAREMLWQALRVPATVAAKS